MTKETKKEIISEEKKEGMEEIAVYVGGAILMYFMYRWFIDPFGDIFGLNKWWKIGIAIFIYGAGVGGILRGIKQNTFYKTHRHGMKVSKEDDSTSKIAKLKELKDKGAISKEEFEKKKKELLEKV